MANNIKCIFQRVCILISCLFRSSCYLLPTFSSSQSFYYIIPHFSFQSHISLCLFISLYLWAQPLKRNLLNMNFSVRTSSQLRFWIIMDGCHDYFLEMSFSGFVFNGFVNVVIFLPLSLHLTMLTLGNGFWVAHFCVIINWDMRNEWCIVFTRTSLEGDHYWDSHFCSLCGFWMETPTYNGMSLYIIYNFVKLIIIFHIESNQCWMLNPSGSLPTHHFKCFLFSWLVRLLYKLTSNIDY